jgi:hypothetical protein
METRVMAMPEIGAAGDRSTWNFPSGYVSPCNQALLRMFHVEQSGVRGVLTNLIPAQEIARIHQFSAYKLDPVAKPAGLCAAFKPPVAAPMLYC